MTISKRKHGPVILFPFRWNFFSDPVTSEPATTPGWSYLFRASFQRLIDLAGPLLRVVGGSDRNNRSPRLSYNTTGLRQERLSGCRGLRVVRLLTELDLQVLGKVWSGEELFLTHPLILDLITNRLRTFNYTHIITHAGPAPALWCRKRGRFGAPPHDAHAYTLTFNLRRFIY